MIDTSHDQPAFPRTYSDDGHNGMTLRDYFAIRMMPGFIELIYSIPNAVNGDENVASLAASKAYAAADAMLKARTMPPAVLCAPTDGAE
jgi:hypothetical protein